MPPGSNFSLAYQGIESSPDHEMGLHAAVHCVGTNPAGEADGWQYSSCLYRNMCLDMASDEWLLHLPERAPHSSTVAVGVLNGAWTKKDKTRLRFTPREIHGAIPSGATWAHDHPLLSAYAARANSSGRVWLLWHSMAAHNVGHLLWDDLLPLFTLRSLFGLVDALPLQLQLHGSPLWATCDSAASHGQISSCDKKFSSWLPLLGLPSLPPPRTKALAGSGLLCFPWVASGMGMLSDHCDKLHGWVPKDYQKTCNVGKGAQYWQFRTEATHHAAAYAAATPAAAVPTPAVASSASVQRRIIFSQVSSRDQRRRINFTPYVRRARALFSTNGWRVEHANVADLSPTSQVLLAATSAIWVTPAGGGAVTATFLPRGASLILLYAYGGKPTPRATAVRQKNFSAFLDWDFFNHASYLRTAWEPMQPRDSSIERIMDQVASAIQHSETFVFDDQPH